MDWTNWVAIYAAIISTIVLLWDIIKWKEESSVKLKITYRKDMIIIDGSLDQLSKKHIFVEVINRNQNPTTITNWTAVVYKDLKYFNEKKGGIGLLHKNPSPNQPLPYLLCQGMKWSGLMEQDVFDDYKNKIIVFEIHHTQSDTPDRQIVEI